MAARPVIVAVLFGTVALFLAACRDDRARLNSALAQADHRSVIGRLYGAAWAPRLQPTSLRTAEVSVNDLRLRTVAGEIYQSSNDEELKASAALLAEHYDDGKRRLQALADRRTATAAVW